MSYGHCSISWTRKFTLHMSNSTIAWMMEICDDSKGQWSHSYCDDWKKIITKIYCQKSLFHYESVGCIQTGFGRIQRWKCWQRWKRYLSRFKTYDSTSIFNWRSKPWSHRRWHIQLFGEDESSARVIKKVKHDNSRAVIFAQLRATMNMIEKYIRYMEYNYCRIHFYSYYILDSFLFVQSQKSISILMHSNEFYERKTILWTVFLDFLMVHRKSKSLHWQHHFLNK